MDTPADYQAHHAELLRAAQARIGPRYAGRVDASSIVQEVYLDLCGRESSAVDLAELRLRVRHKVIDVIRRLTAAKRGGTPPERLDLAGGSIDPPAPGPSPCQAASFREVLALLDGPSDLTAAEAGVVRAYYLERRTYREIAERFGLPPGSVGDVLARGLKKLRGRDWGRGE